jgi:hypothetical protein
VINVQTFFSRSDAEAAPRNIVQQVEIGKHGVELFILSFNCWETTDEFELKEVELNS